MDLTLNEKYSYEDIPRLLNWSKYISAQIIGGYRYDDETNTLPVLVNYNKEDDAIAYEDHFENEEYLSHFRKLIERLTVKILKSSSENNLSIKTLKFCFS